MQLLLWAGALHSESTDPWGARLDADLTSVAVIVFVYCALVEDLMLDGCLNALERRVARVALLGDTLKAPSVSGHELG